LIRATLGKSRKREDMGRGEKTVAKKKKKTKKAAVQICRGTRRERQQQ